MFTVRYRESMWHRRWLAGPSDHTIHRCSPSLPLPRRTRTTTLLPGERRSGLPTFLSYVARRGMLPRIRSCLASVCVHTILLADSYCVPFSSELARYNSSSLLLLPKPGLVLVLLCPLRFCPILFKDNPPPNALSPSFPPFCVSLREKSHLESFILLRHFYQEAECFPFLSTSPDD